MEVVVVLALLLACPLLAITVPLLTIVLVGLRRRKQLDREIAAREQRVAHLLALNIPELGPGRLVTLVTGSVVYAPDAAARNAHRWRRLFGGSSQSIQLRVESARRLATVRALEEASQLGARAVLNLRFQSCQLNQGRRNRQLPLIELIAYGTAWVPPA